MTSFPRLLVVPSAALLLLLVACGSSSPPARSPTPSPAGDAGAAIATPRIYPTVTARVVGSTRPDSVSALSAYRDHVWIAADDTVLASADRGAHWQQFATIEDGILSLSFASDSNGWAATPSGLLHTTDGGESWQRAAGLQEAVGRVRFGDPQHGWAVTRRGGLVRTSDGGSTWSDLTNPCAPGPGNEFAAMALPSFTSADDGWVLCPGQPSAGSQGKELFRTTDGGGTWLRFSSAYAGMAATPSPLPLPATGYASDLFFLDALHGWMSEDRGGVMQTDDGARSWRAQAFITVGNPAEDADGVVFTSALAGFAFAGWPGYVAATTDGGSTWAVVYTLPQLQPPPAATPDADATFALRGQNTTWAALLPGYQVRSSLVLGSDAWAVAAPCKEDQLPPFKATAVGRSTVLQCPSNVLLHSSDGGSSWEQYSPTGVEPQSVFQVSGRIRITGSGGTFESDDRGATWTRVRPQLVPGN